MTVQAAGAVDADAAATLFRRRRACRRPTDLPVGDLAQAARHGPEEAAVDGRGPPGGFTSATSCWEARRRGQLVQGGGEPELLEGLSPAIAGYLTVARGHTCLKKRRAPGQSRPSRSRILPHSLILTFGRVTARSEHSGAGLAVRLPTHGPATGTPDAVREQQPATPAHRRLAVMIASVRGACSACFAAPRRPPA